MLAPTLSQSRAPEAPELEYPLLTAAQVGEMLGIPAKTVLQFAREGRLPVIELGKHRRFCRAQVAGAVNAAAHAGRAI